jgi:hypothetical protein
MDPYLEDRNVWSGFHHSLADEIKGELNARIGPKYYADVNVHTVFEDVTIALPPARFPDVGVLERYRVLRETQASAIGISPAPLQRIVVVPEPIKLRRVEVRGTENGELVTAIEILSPYNKRHGKGLDDYRAKRQEILFSDVHLVEIDLLRGGERPGSEVNDPPLDTDYLLIVNRFHGSGAPRVSEMWPLALNERLPVLPIPLLRPDPDAPLDLNITLAAIYQRSGYDWRIDYGAPVPPPELRPAMAEWLKQNLPQVGKGAR